MFSTSPQAYQVCQHRCSAHFTAYQVQAGLPAPSNSDERHGQTAASLPSSTNLVRKAHTSSMDSKSLACLQNLQTWQAESDHLQSAYPAALSDTLAENRHDGDSDARQLSAFASKGYSMYQLQVLFSVTETICYLRRYLVARFTQKPRLALSRLLQTMEPLINLPCHK